MPEVTSVFDFEIKVKNKVGRVSILKEWEAIAFAVLTNELLKDRRFIQGREMVFKNNIEIYGQRVIESYDKYKIYPYFNNLDYAQQKELLIGIVIIQNYLENNPKWFMKKLYERYEEILTSYVMKAAYEKKVDFADLFLYCLYSNRQLNKLNSLALFVIMALDFLREEDNKLEIIVDSEKMLYGKSVLGYENAMLFEVQKDILPSKVITEAQAVFAEIANGKKWKYKEKKTLGELIDVIVRGADNETDQLAESGFLNIQELSMAMYSVQPISIAEWTAALMKTKDSHSLEPYKKSISNRERLAIVVNLIKWVNKRETIVIKKNLLVSEIQNTKFNNIVGLEPNAKNGAVESKISNKNESNDIQEEKIKQLKLELQWTQEQLKITKQNSKILEQQNRELTLKLGAYETAKINEVEVVEAITHIDLGNENIEEEYNVPEGFKLPPNIVMITGHPNLRNKVKQELNWEVVDIDKLWEVNKIKRADVIVYNYESVNHTVFKLLEKEHLDKLVYIDGGTNIKLIEQKVKKEWYSKMKKVSGV